MTTTLGKVALAAAAAALSLGAQANLVTFDDLWAPYDDTNDKPVAVGSLGGLGFSGATAYRAVMLDYSGGTDGAVPRNADSTPRSGGFVISRPPRLFTCDAQGNQGAGNLGCDPSPSGPISIGLLDPTQVFTSVQFLYGISGGASIGLLTGGQWVRNVDLTGGSANMPWNVGSSIPILASDKINRIDFTPVSGAVIALDELTFETARISTPPPNVPEPASYALVAVALVAAGAARRRRQA